MRSICTLAFVGLMLQSAFGIDAKETELKADDIASFLGVNHNTFTFEHDGTIREITYTFYIYRDGKVVYQGRGITMGGAATGERHRRVSVVYKDEADSITFTIRTNGSSGGTQTIKKPEGVGKFMHLSGGASFDKKDRLVIAFSTKDNRITSKSSSPEGAKTAFVLQIKNGLVNTAAAVEDIIDD